MIQGVLDVNFSCFGGAPLLGPVLPGHVAVFQYETLTLEMDSGIG